MNNEFLGWDEGFTAEESQFTLLPEGTYPFVVTKMDRKVYEGNSSKIPNGAPYAEVTIKVDGGEYGSTNIVERLYLMKSMQWKLTQFFAGIGQDVIIGQPFKPNWQSVLGSSGMVEISINQYTTSTGEQRKNNRVKEYKTTKDIQNSTMQPQQPQQFNSQGFNGAF